jgi:LPXTG-site transpeptidase (sortase) family protein
VRNLLKLIEGLLWVSGLAMIGIFLGELGFQKIERNSALAAYKAQLPTDAAALGEGARPTPADNTRQREARQTEPRQIPAGDIDAGTVGFEAPAPDQSLWSAGRIAAFAESFGQQTSPVLGVFEIPKFDIELPIYDGASDLHMDRGIARIEGTAMPGQGDGNVGIAGHRDGYFRVLKDIQFGDEISVRTPSGTQTYIVQQLMIVDPSAVEVLNYTPEPSITLVTCYPFYFVGHAPERFIVRAVLQENT